jgi:hypothetical protein
VLAAVVHVTFHPHLLSPTFIPTFIPFSPTFVRQPSAQFTQIRPPNMVGGALSSTFSSSIRLLRGGDVPIFENDGAAKTEWKDGGGGGRRTTTNCER